MTLSSEIMGLAENIHVFDDVISHVTSHVTNGVISHVIDDVISHVTRHVTDDVISYLMIQPDD